MEGEGRWKQEQLNTIKLIRREIRLSVLAMEVVRSDQILDIFWR